MPSFTPGYIMRIINLIHNQIALYGFNNVTDDIYTNTLRNIAVLYNNNNVTSGNTTVPDGINTVTGGNSNGTALSNNVTGGNYAVTYGFNNVTYGNNAYTCGFNTVPGGNSSVTSDASPVRFASISRHRGRDPCMLPIPHLPVLCKTTTHYNFNNIKTHKNEK